MAVNKLLVAAFIFLLVAGVIELIAFAIPYWVDYGVNDSDTYFGLWNYCVSTTTCSSTADTSGLDTEWLRAVKAFASMAFISLLTGVATIIFRLACAESIIVTIIATVMVFTSVLFVAIALIVFGAKVDGVSTLVNFTEYLHAGFYLAMTGAIVSLVAGLFLLCAMCKKAKNVVEKIERVDD